MPYVIVAQTVGIDRNSLLKHLPGYQGTTEWQVAWFEILNNPKLRRLHMELNYYDSTAPRKEAA